MESPYALDLESELDPATTQSILAVLGTIGVATWLEQHPFVKLQFKSRVLFDQQEVYGLYSYANKTAEICVTRDLDSYGVELVWGQIQAVSHVALTLLDAIIRTFIHELGHHLHAALLRLDQIGFAMSMRAIRSNAVSQYAKKQRNPEEYFAECFSAWVFHRPEFIFYDSLGYGMIERALSALGLQIGEL